MRNLIAISAAFEAGDLAVWFGLVWTVTTNSAVEDISILLAATALARIIVGIAGSSWFQRLTLPRYLRAAGFGYAAITLVMCFALLLGASVDTLIIIEVVRSVLATIIRVQRETLFCVASEANKRIAGHWVSVTHTVRVIVPSVAGALIAVISLPALCCLAAVSTGTYALFYRDATQSGATSAVRSRQVSTEIAHADVRWITTFMLFANAATAPLGVFLPAIFVHEFNVGIVSFGVAEGLLALGCVIGACASPSAVQVRLSHLYGSAIAQASLYGFLWHSKGIMAAYVLLFLIGLCIGYVQACILSAYLHLIPNASYGVIRSRQMALSGIAFSLSSAVAGLIASNASFQLIPIYQAAFWMGAFFVLAITVRWRTTFLHSGEQLCGKLGKA